MIEIARNPDPRDKVWTSAISRYRKAKPGTTYAEAARAVCFDEPWASGVQAALAKLPPPPLG